MHSAPIAFLTVRSASAALWPIVVSVTYHRGDNAKFPDFPEFVEHSDAYPLARLLDVRDSFNVVRETLNAARQGRIPPGQVYAVRCMVEVWLKVRDRMDYKERQLALDSQYVAKVLEAEEEIGAAGDDELSVACGVGDARED